MSTTAAPSVLALPARLTVTRYPDGTLNGRPYVTDATGAHVCEGFAGPGKPEALAALVERANSSATLPETLRRAAFALQCAADLYRWRAEVECPAKGAHPSQDAGHLADVEAALSAVRGELAKLDREGQPPAPAPESAPRVYRSQAARDAQAAGYGAPGYWDELERSAFELHGYFRAKGDFAQADAMLTRSLSDALQGNDGV